VNTTITAVDFPVFQERTAKGQFDCFIGAWQDEPSPRGLADQWTRKGWGDLNYGHYSNPVFDSLFARAANERRPAAARLAWREALDTLNVDAPAAFLYALTNEAVVARRLQRVEIDPYSWLSGVADWTIDLRQALPRDRETP
jgi:ABC-type oligopeptide transport system substrate-binding subunit